MTLKGLYSVFYCQHLLRIKKLCINIQHEDNNGFKQCIHPHSLKIYERKNSDRTSHYKDLHLIVQSEQQGIGRSCRSISELRSGLFHAPSHDSAMQQIPCKIVAPKKLRSSHGRLSFDSRWLSLWSYFSEACTPCWVAASKKGTGSSQQIDILYILSDLKLWLRIFIPPKVPDWRVAARTCDCCTRDWRFISAPFCEGRTWGRSSLCAPQVTQPFLLTFHSLQLSHKKLQSDF